MHTKALNSVKLVTKRRHFLQTASLSVFAVNTEQKAAYIERSSVHCYNVSTEINRSFHKIF